MKKILLLPILLFFATGFAQSDLSLVTVTGTGTVHVVPDKVLIRARIEHSGKMAAEVKAKNDQVVSEIIRFLESQDIPSNNFKTEYITLNKEYNYTTKESFISANQAISIELDHLEKYEEVMSGLLASGLNRIDGVNFESSAYKKLESEARIKAVLDARKKAQELSEALGQELGKAHMIQEIENRLMPTVMYKAMESRGSDGGKTIAPGEMEVTVKVNASFYLN